MSSTASNTHQNTSGGPTSHNNKSTGATSTTDSSSHASAVYVATRLCETLFSLVMEAARRGHETSIETGHSIINSVCAPSFKALGCFGGLLVGEQSVSEFKSFFDAMKHAMPDMTTAVFDVTPSTSTGGALSVMMRCVTSGKFIHPFMSLAPTNTRVVFSSVIVVRFSSANAVDYVEYFNDSASLANVGLDVASLCPPGGLKDGWKAVAGGGGSRPSSSSAAGGGAHKSGSAVA